MLRSPVDLAVNEVTQILSLAGEIFHSFPVPTKISDGGKIEPLANLTDGEVLSAKIEIAKMLLSSKQTFIEMYKDKEDSGSN